MPVATEAPTLTVRVDELPALTAAGLTDAVGPDGETPALKLIVPAEPTRVVLIVLVPLSPCWTLKLVGLAEIVKSAGGGAAVTVTLTVVECVLVPSLPVTVTV